MATQQQQTRHRGSTTAPLEYRPNDGYVYRWWGGEYAEVYRIVVHAQGLDYRRTDLHVPMAEASRTAESLAVAVDEWRTGTDPFVGS